MVIAVVADSPFDFVIGYDEHLAVLGPAFDGEVLSGRGALDCLVLIPIRLADVPLLFSVHRQREKQVTWYAFICIYAGFWGGKSARVMVEKGLNSGRHGPADSRRCGLGRR